MLTNIDRSRCCIPGTNCCFAQYTNRACEGNAVCCDSIIGALVQTLFVVKRHRKQIGLHSSNVVLPIHFVVVQICVVHMIWHVVTTMATFLAAVVARCILLG